MVTPPKNRSNTAAKVAMAAMCVSVSCSALAEKFPEKTGCEIINHANYQEFMEPQPNRVVANPFKPETCVMIDYSEENVNTLTPEHFGGNEDIMKYFLAQQKVSKMRVEMVMDYETQQLHTFMKFDADNRDARNFRKMAKGTDIIAFWDEFVFLHELAHFDPSVTLNASKGDMAQRELMSDLTALIMLKTNHDLTMDQFFDLSDAVFDIRKEEMRLFERQQRRQSKRRTVGDHAHFDKSKLEKIESFLTYLKDTKIELRIDTLSEAREVAAHMMHNYQGSEMINHESKTMSLDNDQYRQAFFTMEPGEQMMYYENNKGLMGSEILTLFEDYNTMLPAQQQKLDSIAPEIIADASQYFHSDVQVYAQQHLSSIHYGEPDGVELTASVTMEPTVEAGLRQEQVSMQASSVKPR
tara:strand:- start:6116 stop:7348 length:1233 start_codon:yes stop_codon:yes gene_type:complete